MNLGEKLVVAGVVFLPAVSAVFFGLIPLWDHDDAFQAMLLALASAAVAVALGLLTSGILLLRRNRVILDRKPDRVP
jgi:hypothetical protein